MCTYIRGPFCIFLRLFNFILVSMLFSSMSKISDNASEGSYHDLGNLPQGHQKNVNNNKASNKHASGAQQQIDKFRHTKQATHNSSQGGLAEMKIDGGKTFNNGSTSEHIAMEEYSNAAGGTVPIIGQPQAALPPIVMPTKKGGAATGKHHHHKGVKGTTSSNIAAFNTTKKQFPQLNKLNQHKKNSYVSPYSMKTISKPP